MSPHLESPTFTTVTPIQVCVCEELECFFKRRKGSFPRSCPGATLKTGLLSQPFPAQWPAPLYKQEPEAFFLWLFCPNAHIESLSQLSCSPIVPTRATPATRPTSYLLILLLWSPAFEPRSALNPRLPLTLPAARPCPSIPHSRGSSLGLCLS